MPKNFTSDQIHLSYYHFDVHVACKILANSRGNTCTQRFSQNQFYENSRMRESGKNVIIDTE